MGRLDFGLFAGSTNKGASWGVNLCDVNSCLLRTGLKATKFIYHRPLNSLRVVTSVTPKLGWIWMPHFATDFYLSHYAVPETSTPP